MTDTDPAQSALEALQLLDKGQLLTDLGESLQTATKATRERHKPSKVMVTIDLRPSDIGDQWMVVLHGEVKTSIPPTPRGVTLFYSDEEGNLHRRDPRQAELWASPRAVAPSGEPVDTETGELRQKAPSR